MTYRYKFFMYITVLPGPANVWGAWYHAGGETGGRRPAARSGGA